MIFLRKISRNHEKNSKRKGANFERKVVKILEERFDHPFSRTPGSGAFATTHKTVQDMSGDIIVPAGFRFCIEAKCGYDHELHLTKLFDPRSRLYDFIRQVVRDSKKMKKDWMLIWKGTRKQALVFTEKDSFPRCPKVQVNTRCWMYRLQDVIDQEDCYWFI
jgi:Holliday junction resolvase